MLSGDVMIIKATPIPPLNSILTYPSLNLIAVGEFIHHHESPQQPHRTIAPLPHGLDGLVESDLLHVSDGFLTHSIIGSMRINLLMDATSLGDEFLDGEIGIDFHDEIPFL